MAARVGKALIGVRSPRGIEWYKSPSVSMPIAPSSRQLESTCPGNSSTRYGSRFNQRSDTVGTRCFGIRQSRGIEWYRFRSVHMAIDVSRMKKADISGGRWWPELGRVSLESAR